MYTATQILFVSQKSKLDDPRFRENDCAYHLDKILKNVTWKIIL